MEIFLIILAVIAWCYIYYSKPKKKSNHLIANSDYQGRYEPAPSSKEPITYHHSKIFSKLTPLKRKTGGFRKTRNNIINDELEHILFDRSIEISFYYTGSSGLMHHKIMVTYIMGTEQGTPVYICGNKIEDEEYEDDNDNDVIPEFENLGKFLTFRMDRMTHIDYKDRIYKTPDAFILAINKDYPPKKD
jgi:hypothetical protein